MNRYSKLPILVVPACGKGMGGGHLTRCITLVNGLRALGREAWLFFQKNSAVDNFLETNNFNSAWLAAENDLRDKNWGCIILDCFQTSPEELAHWTKLAPVIGLDEGGPCRNKFDFLIDILPNLSRIRSNIADPSLLPLPDKDPAQRRVGMEIPCRDAKNTKGFLNFKVLISFGHEDAAEIGVTVAEVLAVEKGAGFMNITLLRGGLKNDKLEIRNEKLKILNFIHNLSEHLHEYDLIITHYGLTAFEALYAGVPVLLVSPTRYHEKLAKNAGFYSLGTGKGRAARIAGLLFKNGKPNVPFLENLQKRYAGLAVRHNLNYPQKETLAGLINNFTPDVSRNCPACGMVLHGSALARFPERTYRRCKNCGVIGMERLNPPPIEYQREYFFEQYQKQYGKTYIEDFPNLIVMAKRRLAVIKKIRKKLHDDATSLLDIGCAYGPFLAVAKEEGFSPFGIDPAEDAVNYVTQELGLPAVQGFFPELGGVAGSSPQRGGAEDLALARAEARGSPPIGGATSPLYSVVTLWYVIEHFRGCVPALVEIQKLLKPGGVLAFSTPSFAGVSGCASLKCFLERSPVDHWTIWSPASCKKALRQAGFRVKKIVTTGHHPERFPALGKFARNEKSPLYRLLLTISKLFSLGDTFEAYAVKDE